MGLGPSIAESKSVLVKPLLLVALGLPASVPLAGVQAVDQTSANVDMKPHTQTPFRRRTITIDDQVKRFTESLDLSETQQSEIKRILELRQVQIRRIRLDESLSGDERIGRLRDLQDSTVAQIRAVLSDEQKKKYDPLAVRQAQKNSPQPSVEDWMKAAAQTSPLTGTATGPVALFFGFSWTNGGTVGAWLTATGARTITVTNTGPAGSSLALSAVPVVVNLTGGAQFARTGGTCSATTVLASGGTCTLIVIRTRPKTGSTAGTGALTVTDTGAATASQQLALSGT
jgi:hypothetical protein